MKTKTKIFSWVAAAVLTAAMLISLAGCGNEPSASTPANSTQTAGSSAKKDTLILAGDYGSPMNPVLHNTADVQSVIFSGLLKLDSKNQPILDLAKSYDYDEASMTYTFHLREGVKWHDGKEFTADDCVFTYTVLTQDKSISSDVLSNYLDVASVSAPDKLTFVVKMKEPNLAMPAYFTIGIIPKHLLEGKDINTDAFNQHPIGTGRYKFVSKDTASNSVVLERNEDYYDNVPKIKSLIFKNVADETVKANMAQSGEVDIAWLNANYIKSFQGNPDYQITRHNCCDFRGITLRYDGGFWKDNADSAYALNYAIDKQAILKATVDGKGEVAYSPLQKTNLGGNKNADLYPYDVAQAAKELEKLGWKKGGDGILERNGQRFSFTLMAPESEVERVDMAKLVADQLKAVGVEVKVFPLASWDWTGYDSYLVGEAFIFDADQCYAFYTTGGSNNGQGYSNQKVDELLARARHETDLSKRQALYGEFEVEQAKNPRVLLLNYLDAFYVSKSQIRGIDEGKILGHHSRGMLWNVENWYFE